MKKKSEIQIFLAHASEDKPAVLKLYDRLKAAGYKPWLDKKDLIPGQIWRDEIPKVIKNSDIFLACLSSKSANKRGYIQREFRIALDAFGEMPSGTIFFIPMRLEECEIPDLQLSEGGRNLRDIHWLDYWEEDGFEKLERAIAFQFGFWTEEREAEYASSTEAEESAPEAQASFSLQQFQFETVTVNRQGKIINRESKTARYYSEDLDNGITLEMVAVPGGIYLMGTEDEEIERLVKKFYWDGYRRERPQHQVTVQPFFMGKYPITQAEWKAIAERTDLKVKRDLDPDPAYFKDRPDSDRRPVEQVNWYDAKEFCARLSKLTGREYRLPSEAEWEYACRAGTTTPFYFGETITGELANYDASRYTYADEAKGQYREETTPVGQFLPNAFGLYDMHGQVWEWCADTWHENYEGAPSDGSAWLGSEDDNDYQVLRGGSWILSPLNCRSAIRNWDWRVINDQRRGFRVVCVSGRTLL